MFLDVELSLSGSANEDRDPAFIVHILFFFLQNLLNKTLLFQQHPGSL